MKKYLVIGNPIKHSLSPKIHNFWLKKNNINAIYEMKKLESVNLKKLILDIKSKEIAGVNVTIPFKNEIISYLDKLSPEAKQTQSVNTIFLKNNKVIGHNTDINGFELSVKGTKFNPKNKKILILGAGGVVPSIIYALRKMKVSQIMLSNRTKSKAKNLKKLFKNLVLVNWGKVPNPDMIINATSIGLKKSDKIKIDFSNVRKNTFFYDIIYNPKETNFLKIGKKLSNYTKNGKMMFVFQASAAFNIWHGIKPKINSGVIKILDQ
jgi:shikimate dehydrogenase